MIGKLVMLLGLALVVSSSPALAAQLTNLEGQSCGSAEGTWHFVNVQTERAPGGILTATFTNPDTRCEVGATSVNNRMQHFYCIAPGTLTGASSDLPGYIRLSDFSCVTQCEKDPKTQECKK